MIQHRRYRHRSFGDILRANGGAGRGFDLLRLTLALLILLSHASGLMGHSGTTAWLQSLIFGTAPPATPALPLLPPAGAALHAGAANGGMPGAQPMGITAPFIRALVPMFFVLSGFLVTGSAYRTRSLLRFLGLRVLRIVPALFVEVFLSAVLLGALFTTLPLRAYFADPGFLRYFLNIVGVVQFHLPGVFEHSTDRAVNANLWTLPFELECYVVISAIILLGLLRRRTLMTIAFAALTIVLIVANGVYGVQADMLVFDGRALIYCFLCGVMGYMWRDRISFRPLYFGLACAASFALLLHMNMIYLAAIGLTYVTLFIGLAPVPQFEILKSGDYSYGIYLYGYPMTQVIANAGGRQSLNFLVACLIASLATCGFAYLSWHGVEKHFLKLKRFLSEPSATVTQTLHPDIG